MKMRLLCFCLLSICMSTLFAQTRDTLAKDTLKEETIVKHEGGGLNKGDAYQFTEKPFLLSLPDIQFVDTLSFQVHRYSSVEKETEFRNYLGNIGQPSHLVEHQTNPIFDHQYGLSPFDFERYHWSRRPFFQVFHPYTVLNYIMGAKREQSIEVLHTQNVLRGLNFGGEFRILNSPGYYQTSYTKNINARAFTNYVSKDRRYRLLGSYTYNNLFSQENGGLVANPDSLEFLPTNRKVLPTKLTSATQSWREHAFFIKQIYQFGVPPSDSLGSFLDLGYLMHTSEMQRSRRYYSESSPEAFYDTSYFDPKGTHDTLQFVHTAHTFAYGYGDVEVSRMPHAINAMVAYRYETMALSYDSLSVYTYGTYARTYDIHSVLGSVGFRILPALDIRARGEWRLNGRFKGDHQLEATLRFRFQPKKNDDGLRLRVSHTQESISEFDSRYASNHYIWENQFSKPKISLASIEMNWLGIKLSGSFAHYENSIFYTFEGPRQLAESYTIWSGKIEKNFHWRWIRFDNRVVVQKASREDAIHLPLVYTRNALYADFMLLKVTNVQVGFDVRYNTKYYADSYNPALGHYTWQDRYQTGNFVFVDVFLNLRIQRANIFVKLENLTANWLGYNYSDTPGYFLPERSIKFGVFWRFYD